MTVISRKAFAFVMDFLTTSLGVTPDAHRREAYYRMLCDLDAPCLWRAVCELVATRPYPTLPLIGEIRRQAAAIKLELRSAPSPTDSWALLLDLVGVSDFDQVLAQARHPLLREFLVRFGRRNWQELVTAGDRATERRRFEIAYSEFLRARLEDMAARVPDSLLSAATDQLPAIRAGGETHGDS